MFYLIIYNFWIVLLTCLYVYAKSSPCGFFYVVSIFCYQSFYFVYLTQFILSALVYIKFSITVLGAIFDDGSFLLEAAFNIALTAASKDPENPFVANVIRTSPGDILETETAMCTLLEVMFEFHKHLSKLKFFIGKMSLSRFCYRVMCSEYSDQLKKALYSIFSL